MCIEQQTAKAKEKGHVPEKNRPFEHAVGWA
jgi:hypothetical protein